MISAYFNTNRAYIDVVSFYSLHINTERERERGAIVGLFVAAEKTSRLIRFRFRPFILYSVHVYIILKLH